jgi:hypothetical protein
VPILQAKAPNIVVVEGSSEVYVCIIVIINYFKHYHYVLTNKFRTFSPLFLVVKVINPKGKFYYDGYQDIHLTNRATPREVSRNLKDVLLYIQ